MIPDNPTPEELTDLLEEQVVLTLINDCRFYNLVEEAVERQDYKRFVDVATVPIRKETQRVCDVDLQPTRRSRMLIWEYYMRDVDSTYRPDDTYRLDLREKLKHDDTLRKSTTKEPPMYKAHLAAGEGYTRVTHLQAKKLKYLAEYFWDDEWHACEGCAFDYEFPYRAPTSAVYPLLPSTPKETTMTSITQSFDASVPVTNVTLIYGKPAKDYSESDLLLCVRKLDADIETYTKSEINSTRIQSKLKTLRAERIQIIQAFDAVTEGTPVAADGTAV